MSRWRSLVIGYREVWSHISERNHQQLQKQQHREQDQIEWRRSQVLELSSQGQTERQIATVLQVGKTTVHKDLAYLSRQAKEI